MSEPTPEPVETPTPQPENTAVQYLNDEGKFTQAFRDALPDDLGKHSYFDKYENIEEAVKGAINTQNLVGKKAEEFWTSEDPNDVQRRKEIMGVPKDVSGYDFKVEIPEGANVEMIQGGIEEFKQFAFEQGLSADMVQKIVEFDLQRGSALAEKNDVAQHEAMQEAEKSLRAEWTGNKYEYNVAKAKDALEYLGLGDWVENPAIANDPKFIKDVFEKIVPLTSDDVIVEARQQQSYATVSDSLKDIEGKIYGWQGSTMEPGYRKLVDERTELLKKLQKSA